MGMLEFSSQFMWHVSVKFLGHHGVRDIRIKTQSCVTQCGWVTCTCNFSLGNGKSTINVLGVGSGTGKELNSTADAGGWGSPGARESSTQVLGNGENCSSINISICYGNTLLFMTLSWLCMSKSKESSRLGRRAPSNLIRRNYRNLGFVPPKGHALESPTQRHLPTLCIAFRVCRGESWAFFGCRWCSTSRDECGLATAISRELCQLLQDVLFKSYYCFYLETSGV